MDEECKEYAVKIIDLSKYDGVERDARRSDYLQELKLLQNIDSQYVTKFYGDVSDPNNHQHYLLLEYCNSDLQKLINCRRILPENQAEAIIRHVF